MDSKFILKATVVTNSILHLTALLMQYFKTEVLLARIIQYFGKCLLHQTKRFRLTLLRTQLSDKLFNQSVRTQILVGTLIMYNVMRHAKNIRDLFIHAFF